MRNTDRRRWAAVLASIALALGAPRPTFAEEMNFWQRSKSKSQVLDATNNTNWAANQVPPPGTNMPIGPSPAKPNIFKRAASSVGSAATSMSNGVKGMFKGKDKVGGADNSVTTTMPAKRKPLDANFHVTLAGVQEQSGNFQGAEEQYQRALEIERDNLQALLGYGRLCDRKERPTEALRFYQQATKKHPKEPAAWNDLGLCHSRMNRPTEAATALEKAVALDPHKKLYRNNLATVLVKLNRADQALQQLAAVHPKAIANYNVGYLLTQQNDRQLAYRYFSEAMLADPNLKEARQWREVLAPSVAGLPPQSRQADGMPPNAPHRNAERPPAFESPRQAAPRLNNSNRTQAPSAEPSAARTPSGPLNASDPIREARRSAARPPAIAEKPAAHHVAAEQLPEVVESVQSNEPTDPPLPQGDDVLSAPRADTIGAPSRSDQPSHAVDSKRTKRSGSLAPSRY